MSLVQVAPGCPLVTSFSYANPPIKTRQPEKLVGIAVIADGFAMIRQGIAIALIVLGTTVAGWAQEVDWQMDLDAAKTSAARQGKLVLIHFSADWCRPCQHLETFVFTSPKLITAINERVIPVHIDTDLHPELVKQYNVTQIPTDVVIAPTGRVVQKRQSPKDVNNYLRMLESLDSVEKELSQDRAALAQKIDHILESGSNKLPSPTESNAFVPQLARTKAPDASPLGSQLQAKAASQAKLLQQVSANEFQVNQTDGSDRPSNQPAEPHRIINDQFLNDQSNEFQAKARACIQHDSSQSSYAVVQCNDCQSDERTESSTATLRPVAGTLATECESKVCQRPPIPGTSAPPPTRPWPNRKMRPSPPGYRKLQHQLWTATAP